MYLAYLRYLFRTTSLTLNLQARGKMTKRSVALKQRKSNLSVLPSGKEPVALAGEEPERGDGL